MKLIRLSFKEKCPYCKHQNDVGTEKWIICENCSEGWNSSIYSKETEEPKIFRDSPIPEGYDRQIRS